MSPWPDQLSAFHFRDGRVCTSTGQLSELADLEIVARSGKSAVPSEGSLYEAA